MGEMDESMNEEVMANMTNALLSIIPISTTHSHNKSTESKDFPSSKSSKFPHLFNISSAHNP